MEFVPEDIESLKLMAAFCLAQDDPESALEPLQQIVTLCPDDAEAHHNLGSVWLNLNQIERAAACFQTALQLDLALLDLHDSLLSQLIQVEQVEPALYLALRSLQVKPDWQPAFIYIGYCLQQQGWTEAARDCGIGLISENVVRGFCRPADNWSVYAVGKSSDTVFCQKIYDEETIALPESVSDRAVLPELIVLPELKVTAPLAEILTLTAGKIWTDSYTRAVFTQAAQLVESASTGNSALIASSNALPPVYSLPGRVVCLSIRYSSNYFHWMYDLLPKIGLVQQSGLDFESIDRWIVNSDRLPFQDQTLSALGIPPEKRIAEAQSYIQADELIVPLSSFNLSSSSLSSFSAGRVPRWVCDRLRQQFLPDLQGSQCGDRKRLLISRSAAAYRRLINQAELLEAIAPFQFECVQLESFSFAEQVAMFNAAEIIIAPHGAGLSNLVFCQPNTTLLEIFLPNEVLDYYRIISAHVGVRYYAWMGEPIEIEASAVQFGQAPTRVVPRYGMTVEPAALIHWMHDAALLV